MRKIYASAIALIFFSFTMLLVASCKKEGFLTATTTTNLTGATVFTDSLNAEGFLANIYSSVGFATSASRFFYKTPSGSTITCGGLDAASDEAEVSHTYSTTALAFATGAINAGLVTDDAYKTCYTQIRAINQLYANINKVPIKPVNRTEMLAEAQFLRAWYYFILLEHYGGVPIVGYNIYDYTKPIPATRSTFDQCVTYITAECDSAYKLLPLTQSGINYGRASGGACLALKARVLLYAASPLFNKPASMSGIETPADIASANVKPLVAYPSYDGTRWAAAEAAAYAVIQTSQYQIFTDSTSLPGYGEVGAFQYLFTVRGSKGNYGNGVNNEYIWNYMEPEGNAILEGLFQPPTRDGANGAFPTQNMVDAFPMANGKAITDPSSEYDPANPYHGRDPRLYYSIIYDQHLMGTRTDQGLINGFTPVNIYLSNVGGNLSGGPDAVYQGTLTGFYNNKMLDPNAVAQTIFQGTNRVIPLIRFAEILLDYAEAANENEGPTANVYTAVETVRQRAGLNPYKLPTGLSQADMRTAIQNERRIELAYEGNRFFDVRRWLIANQTDNVQTNGMEVDRNAQFVPTYKIFPVRKHNFHTSMYLWPFPQAEIGKGSGLLQNPGY